MSPYQYVYKTNSWIYMYIYSEVIMSRNVISNNCARSVCILYVNLDKAAVSSQLALWSVEFYFPFLFTARSGQCH